jgi:hypothetical protein
MGPGITISGLSQQQWYQGVFGALVLIVVLALVLERALAIVFEWGVWDVWLAKTRLRAPIALLVSYIICASLHFDILMVIGNQPASNFAISNVGVFLTAATVAGGSKGAIKLFQDVLGFSKGGNPEAVRAASSAASGAGAAAPAHAGG